MKASTLDFSSTRADDATVANTAAPTWFTSVLQKVCSHFADRSLRRQLADMDDALLRDIGISEEEICRVRHMERITPISWQ